MQKFPIVAAVFCLAELAYAQVDLQVAPLQAMIGQGAFRARWSPQSLPFGIALGYEQFSEESPLEELQNTTKRTGIEGFVNWPPRWGTYAGMGLFRQKSISYHSQRRPYRSSTVFNAKEEFDTWKLEETYTSLDKFVGYRILISQPLVAAVQVNFDRYFDRQVDAQENLSGEPPSSDPSRPRDMTQVMFYMGLSFP